MSKSKSRKKRAPKRMLRWTIRIVVGLGSLIVLAALTGVTYQWVATRTDLASSSPPGQLVDIGGFRLHLWCGGNGTPAVNSPTHQLTNLPIR